MRFSKFVRGACLLLFVCLTAAGGYAQVLSGTLTGQVSDPSGAVIPDARVKAIDQGTGREYSVVTNSSGSYTIPNVPEGFYRLEVEAKGFAKLTVEKIQVNVSQVSKINVELKLATSGTEVVVTAEQSVVQTETIELKYSIDRQQIINLPLPTRNPLDLVRTMPGIATPTTSGIADSFVHGLRGNATNITQDGVNVADNFVKTSSFFSLAAPTVDTVGEFNVSIGGIGADGGFGAAQVSTRTQRGSNDFHGSLFWFQRTNFLNANTWFNNARGVPRPFQLQNRIGVSAGGPVYIPKVYNGRNKTWLFGTYEAFREPVSRPRTRTVLASSARTGLFSWTPPGASARSQINLLSVGTLGNTGAAPAINRAVMDFYNSLVPTDGLTDAGCASGDTVNIRCFAFNLPGKGVQNRYTIRGDHQLTPNHSIEFVYNRSNFDSRPDLLNGIEPQFPKSNGGSQGSFREVWTGAFHSVFGPNKTNEVRYGMTRSPVGFNLFEDYSGTGGFQVAAPGVLTSPTITSTNLPQGRNTPVRQVTDNFAWVKGRHSLRMGGEYRLILANSYFYNVVVPRIVLGSNSANPNGITATDFPGGISSGDLTRAQTVFNMVTGLRGSVSQGFNHTSPTSGFVKGVPRTIDPIQHNVAGYIQDSFKLRPNLTLQFGVRWEFQGVFDLRNGLVLLPQDGLSGVYGPSGLGNLFNPVATPVANDTLLNFSGGRNGQRINDRDWNNFAPFGGFAWSPGKDGKTAIRGGFSTAFTQDGFTLNQLASTGNTGLFSVLANNVPTGVFSNSSNPTPAAPTASFPVSQRANFNANTGSNLWYFDPRLQTPYVLSWNLGVQRELWKRITVEARYFGNHAVKQLRSYSINELNLQSTGLTQEFLNAQKNLAIGGTSFANQGRPGQVALPIFDKLFAGLASTSGFTNSTFLTQLNQNQIGGMFDTIRRSATYRANREASFPLNFFVANPFANQAIIVDNSSWSNYHGLELELNRRFSGGLILQSNYTFSKVLTDTRFLTSQQENQNFFSLRNRRLDKNRAAFDITHSFSASFIYPLPFGRNRQYAHSVNPVVNAIIGGWDLQGTTRWSQGGPFNITSGRLTTSSLEPANAVIRNMTATQVQDQIGVFRTPNGVFWLNPKSGLLTVSGSSSTAVKCTAGQTTPCFDHPGVNEDGNVPYFGLNGPSFFNQDLSVIKRIFIPKVSERFNFEMRLEAFGLFNNPNFGGLTAGIDSSSFGQLTSTVDTVRGGGVTARIVQWAIRVNW